MKDKYRGTILYEWKKGDPEIQLHGSRDVAEWINELFFHRLDSVEECKEHFIGIYMNIRNRVRVVRLLAIGCLNGSLIHPREVFRPAVSISAASVILAHDHPSGDPTPSPEDVQLTERIKEGGKILGIKVLDHVVVAGDGGYASLFNHGV